MMKIRLDTMYNLHVRQKHARAYFNMPVYASQHNVGQYLCQSLWALFGILLQHPLQQVSDILYFALRDVRTRQPQCVIATPAGTTRGGGGGRGG